MFTVNTSWFIASLMTLTCLASVVDAGSIKLCVKMNGKPVPGALVECFDDDLNNDDFMADGITNSKGCVTLAYETKTTSLWKCGDRWDGCLFSNPDIFCEVSADCIAPKKTTTKNNHDQATVANFGTVRVQADLDFCDALSWDGCGPNPLFPPWLKDIADAVSGFESSCNAHDVCYSGCSKSRSQCDKAFKDDMYAQCKGRSICRLMADAFYTAVNVAGEKFCREGRDECTVAQQKSCSQ